MADSLRIGLVGGGAVGSLLAANLLANQQEFTWVVRNALRRKEVADGLRMTVGRPGLLTTDDQQTHLPSNIESRQPVSRTRPLTGVSLVADAAALNALDWVILAVKSYQVQPLLETLGPFPRERLVVVANGLHLDDYCLGVLYGGAFIEPDGRLATTDENTLLVGPLRSERQLSPDQPSSLHDLVCVIDGPQLIADEQDSASIVSHMWHKLALNCVVNPLTALLDLPNGDLLPLLDSPLVVQLLAELHCVTPAQPEGWTRTPAELRLSLAELLKQTGANSSSMREDLRLGRRTEVDALNGAVALRGAELGLDCPVNRMLAGLVQEIQARSV